MHGLTVEHGRIDVECILSQSLCQRTLVAQVVCCVLGMSVGDHMSDQLVRHAWMRCVLEHNACALVISVLSWRLKTARIVRQRVEVRDTPRRLGHTLRVRSVRTGTIPTCTLAVTGSKHWFAANDGFSWSARSVPRVWAQRWHGVVHLWIRRAWI